MKRLSIVIIALLCITLIGCNSDMGGSVNRKQYDVIDNQPVMEWETVEQNSGSNQEDSDATTVEAGVGDSEVNNHNDSVNSADATDKVFKGKTYTFYKSDYENYTEGHWIRGVYDDEMYEFDASYHGLFVGQVVTMFGDESVTYDNETLISYVVAAEDSSGDVIYLEVYYGPSGPAIGGSDGENYDKAAEELEQIIINIEPIDYECVSVYEDAGITIKMGTKNGKGYYETEMDWEE